MTVANRTLPELLAGVSDELNTCLTAVNPSTWQAKLQPEQTTISIVSQRGWVNVATEVNPALITGEVELDAHPWTFVNRQSRYLNAKFAVSMECEDPGTVRLHADLPVDVTMIEDNAVSWLSAVLQTLADPTSSRRLDIQNTSETDFPSELTCELADHGYVFEENETGLLVDVPSGDLVRRIRFRRLPNWLHAELPFGTGNAIRLNESARNAIGWFMFRCGSTVRLARPYCRTIVLPERQGSSGEPEHNFGFETHLPLEPTSSQLNHAFASLVTAVRRYETEIESLATEATLIHAYAAITGGVQYTSINI